LRKIFYLEAHINVIAHIVHAFDIAVHHL